MTDLYHLAYVSEATRLPTSNDLTDILDTARSFNASVGITGMLLYKDSAFVQVLEGSKAKVVELYNRIKDDPRHRRVRTLINEDLEAREFSEWSMGFQNLNGFDASELEGKNDFMSPDFDVNTFVDTPQLAYKILLHFRSIS